MYEHTSTLKFLERLFDLPALASVNHLFDTSTPVGPNYEAAPAGAVAGPPAPRATKTSRSATCSSASTRDCPSRAGRQCAFVF